LRIQFAERNYIRSTLDEPVPTSAGSSDRGSARVVRFAQNLASVQLVARHG
jgi:hypothetical protein